MPTGITIDIQLVNETYAEIVKEAIRKARPGTPITVNINSPKSRTPAVHLAWMPQFKTPEVERSGCLICDKEHGGLMCHEFMPMADAMIKDSK
jgi:hypothetical protein